MSHDRKPGRVRVVKADGGVAKRRRGDGPAGARPPARARASARRGQAMLIVLFLLASIASAVAIELYLPS